MPEEDKKFFDISKPKQVGPQPTSKPIIVGQHPEADPMLKEPISDTSVAESIPVRQANTQLSVNTEQSAATSAGHIGTPAAEVATGIPTPMPAPQMQEVPSPIENNPAPAPLPPAEQPAPAPNFEAPAALNSPGNTFAPSSSQPMPEPAASIPLQDSKPAEPLPQYAPQDEIHLPAGHTAYRHKPRFWAWILVFLVIVAGIYAAVDAKTDVKLPFEIFKQSAKKAPSEKASNASNNTNTTSTLPEGFVRYQPTGTPLTFAYPTEWGEPNTTNDPGFSQRGDNKKSDGVHAYIVKFAKNKDIEIALTSSKYLPAGRTTLYYDYLQWCLGTNDQKFYRSTLNFTTSDGVDKPSTVTCNQGPISGVTKINNAIIVQAKTKDASGATLGDLYTANLSGSDLVVLRVKDAGMDNGANIEKLLGTIAGAPSQ